MDLFHHSRHRTDHRSLKSRTRYRSHLDHLPRTDLLSNLDMACLVFLRDTDNHPVSPQSRNVVVPSVTDVVSIDGSEASRLVDQALWEVLAVPCRVLLAACPCLSCAEVVDGGMTERLTLQGRCSDALDRRRLCQRGYHSMDPSYCRLPRPLRLRPRLPQNRLLLLQIGRPLPNGRRV